MVQKRSETSVNELDDKPNEEIPVLYYKDFIDPLSLQKLQDDIMHLEKSLEELRSDIEIFQSQFSKNIGIQTFTDEYIKECKDMDTKLEKIEDSIRYVMLLRDTSDSVSQDRINK
jgi:hypothetical protein